MSNCPSGIVFVRPIRTGLDTLGGLVGEARPPVQMIFLLRFAATAHLLRPTWRAAEAGAGWVLLTGAIYVLNGVSDVPGDRANGSTRPLASGDLSIRSAVLGMGTATALGLSLCFFNSCATGLLALAMLLLGILYSAGPKLKGHAAGAAVTIGAGAGLTYVSGWSAHQGVTAWRLVFAVAIALWVASASSTKDFSDVVGDRLVGRRTLPVIFGPKRAACLLSVASLIALIAVIATAQNANVGMLPIASLTLGTLILPASCVGVADARERSQSRRPYRVYMSTQYAMNFLMALAIGAPA